MNSFILACIAIYTFICMAILLAAYKFSLEQNYDVLYIYATADVNMFVVHHKLCRILCGT